MTLCYDDTRGQKAAGIADALSRLGVPATAGVNVGGQPSDLLAARKAGVAGIGVSWGFATADELRASPNAIIISDPAELTGDLVTGLMTSSST